MTLENPMQNAVWPVKKIKLAKPLPDLLTRVKSLIEADEVFCTDYLSNDCRSGYIFIEAHDRRSRTLTAILKKYGLEAMIPFVRKGEILLMW